MSRYCAQCGRAKKACICSMIQTVQAKTQLIILQHPTEVKRAKGTAKILTLSLSNCHCFIGEDFSQHSPFNELLQQPGYDNLLLYPAENAMELSLQNIPSAKHKSPRQTKADKNSVRLILLDGTWKKAFKMYQLSTNLHHLPSYRLANSVQGQYTIRKAPDSNSLSTVEAGYHALSVIEPDGDFTPLLFAFEQFVEAYLQQVPAELVKQRYNR